MSQENEIEAEKLSPTTDFLPSGGASCSPSSTPETDALRNSYENYEHRTNTEDLWELCASMERERNELAGYLCRVKLPLPVRFVANLADVFHGENIRMKDEGGHLCIFSENAKSAATGSERDDHE